MTMTTVMADSCEKEELDGGEHCDELEGRMIDIYDDFEEAPGRSLPDEGISNQHNLRRMVQGTHNINGSDAIHVNCRDDVELEEVLQDPSTINVEFSKGEGDVIGRVWNHVDQTYVANGWTTNSVDKQCPSTLDKDLACFFRGKKKATRSQLIGSDGEESDEEFAQLVCSMIGRQWESLPFPIVIDSGACASVLPTDWCRSRRFLPSREWEDFFQ